MGGGGAVKPRWNFCLKPLYSILFVMFQSFWLWVANCKTHANKRTLLEQKERRTSGSNLQIIVPTLNQLRTVRKPGRGFSPLTLSLLFRRYVLENMICACIQVYVDKYTYNNFVVYNNMKEVWKWFIVQHSVPLFLSCLITVLWEYLTIVEKTRSYSRYTGCIRKHATTYNLYLDFVFAGTNQSYISN